MSPRPVNHPEIHAVLPPRLCAGIEDYALAWGCGSSGQDWTGRFDKRDKGTHRFMIADTRGPLALTVPIAKPESSRCRWDEVLISAHGAWWDVHRVALESAYGRTPYFEFYIDRFLPMLTVGVTDRFPRLMYLAMAWDAQLRDILGMPPSSPSPHGMPVIPDVAPPGPYRQVRQDKLGCIAGMSILDLVFNLGPEAQIYLHNLQK